MPAQGCKSKSKIGARNVTPRDNNSVLAIALVSIIAGLELETFFTEEHFNLGSFAKPVPLLISRWALATVFQNRTLTHSG